MSTIGQSISRSRQFLEECWAEVRKVHWPSRTETRGATVAVVAVVLVVGAYLGLVDFACKMVIEMVLY